ncbi:MAG: hypothetical protein BWK78_04580 [Thiotrichaceae bacterium IS1]|nr:MAG: hypothetical protein BWK78_04580 [Thiotrichaceae bacterium IS1]
MSRYNYLLFICLLLFSHSLVANHQGMTCLLNAYPDFLSQSTDANSNVLIWKDGTKMLYDHKIEATDFEDLLNKADLKAQMSIPYPLGILVDPPALNQDPGRLRYEPFFEKMYGNSKSMVRKQLVKVFWAPSNSYVAFSRTNSANEALAAVGKEIMQESNLSGYVRKHSGTFNWRTVQGTLRKSNHSFGVAIDFELPKQLYKYWLWHCKPNQPCQYPKSALTDTTLQRVVSIFEKHGFIWGGKWYHYDTMHFEYRPELINCSTK